MRIIPPITINDARLTSSTVAEPDTAQGEIAWVSGTAYTIGQIRIRTQTHRKYVALTNHTSTTPPENDAVNWKDIGPTNRYAVFDTERNTATMVTGTAFSFVVTPGVRTQALAIFGISGVETVKVTGRSGVGGAIVYQSTVTLSTRTTTTWSQYFFGAFSFRESVVILDLPLQINLSITVEFTRASSGAIAVETCAFGTPVEVGDSQYGATSDVLDFSRIERDAFGNATLVKRKNVPTLNVQVMAKKANVPAIRRLRDQYAATPLVFLALKDSSDDYFDALSMIGIFKRMPIAVEYPNDVLINIEAEGL